MTERPDRPLHHTTRRILGHVVRLSSASDDLVTLADETFAPWPRTRQPAAVRLRIDVHASGAADEGALRYALTGTDRLRIHGPGVALMVDAPAGRARGTISSARLENPANLRYGVIEAATLFLLTSRNRVPFHAAAITRGTTTVLLAGPGGAGKSTSAWAAVRAGWSLLSEDCVFLETGAAPRVWGWPGFVHLESGAARFFEDVRGWPPTVQANGKTKIAMSTSGIRSRRPFARRAALCLLARSAEGPAIEPVDAAFLVRTLTERLEPGFDRFAGRVSAALLDAVEPVAWRLDPGMDPGHVPELLNHLPQVMNSAAP